MREKMQLANDLESTRKEITSMNEQLTSSLSNEEKMRTELENNRIIVIGLEKSLSENKQQIIQLDEYVNRLEDDISVLKQSKESNSAHSNPSLDIELSTLKSLNEEYQIQLASAERTNQSNELLINELKQSNAKESMVLQSKLSQLSLEYDNLVKQVEMAGQEAAEAKEQIEGLVFEKASVETELLLMKNELDSEKEHLNILQKENIHQDLMKSQECI